MHSILDNYYLTTALRYQCQSLVFHLYMGIGHPYILYFHIFHLIFYPNGITNDRLIQIDNTEFFNIFIRRCAANIRNNQRQ